MNHRYAIYATKYKILKAAYLITLHSVSKDRTDGRADIRYHIRIKRSAVG